MQSNANDRDHRRLRRVQAHAFSERALSLQQAYLQKHVDLFISRLGDKIGSTGKGTINAVQWFTYLSTDIIGELAFGENFEKFRKLEMHPWYENLQWSVKSFAFYRELSRYPRVIAYAMLFLVTPRRRVFNDWNAIDFGKELAANRMKHGADQVDFMSYILRASDERR